MEDNNIQKRKVAYKLRIKDIFRGSFVKGEGWNPSYIIYDDKKKISRVNIIGIVVDNHSNENINYQNIVIDDGSSNISARVFDNKQVFEGIEIGDCVLVIGRPREFGNERYIVLEIIKKIENKGWVELRKLELNMKEDCKEQDIEVYDIKENDEEGDNNIFSLIRKLDKGDGVDLNEIIEVSNKEDTEKIINNMIKVGELFEIRPGKIKILE